MEKRAPDTWRHELLQWPRLAYRQKESLLEVILLLPLQAPLHAKLLISHPVGAIAFSPIPSTYTFTPPAASTHNCAVSHDGSHRRYTGPYYARHRAPRTSRRRLQHGAPLASEWQRPIQQRLTHVTSDIPARGLEYWLQSRGSLNLLRTLRCNRGYLRVVTPDI